MEEKRPQEESISQIVEELVERGDKTALKTVLVDLHPADIAEAIERLDREKALFVFGMLDTDIAAEVLVELDTSIRQNILSQLGEKDVVSIVGAMDSDDATDVIGELDVDASGRILNALPQEDFREVKTLLGHDEETAGGIMALEIVAVDQGRTAEDALGELRRKAEDVEDVYNIYVVGERGIFKGLVSLKDLVLAQPNTKLSDFMDREAVTIHQEMDQEEVANLFHKYDLVAAPVVDEEGRLVGRITVDDVLDVVEEEVSEDMTKMAGITDERIRENSIFRLSGVRLPWLLVAFLGEMISAFVLSRFKASMDQIVASAFFIPLIMAMGGNTGTQSATIVIRGLATGDIDLRDTGRRLLREIGVALLNGIVIAIILFVVVSLWQKDPAFGLILSLSMVAVLFNAALMGTLVPFFLKRAGVDPAIATGPFITTSNDVLGLLVYFGMMSLFMAWL